MSGSLSNSKINRPPYAITLRSVVVKTGADAKPVIPALVRAIADPDPSVRHAAIEAVRTIKPGPDVVIPLLANIVRIRSGDADGGDAQPGRNRRACAASIDQVLTIPTVATGLSRCTKWGRKLCLQCQLVESLNDKDLDVRMQILLTLGEIGAYAYEVDDSSAVLLRCPWCRSGRDARRRTQITSPALATVTPRRHRP